MKALKLYILGPFQATLNGRPIRGFSYDKVRLLFAYLAIEANVPHYRETLASLLWPDDSAQAARASLRKALSVLRQVVGDDDSGNQVFIVDRDTIQLNPTSNIWLDVAEFKDHLETCETHPHQSNDECDFCVEEFEAAVDLYRGVFLEGLLVSDSIELEEWILAHREFFRVKVMTALHCLTNFYLKKGNYAKAESFALRQVEMEPYREEARRALMLALARSGQRSAALAHYEMCKRILADELGVEPSHETESLYERIRQAGQTSPNNLPLDLADLIGRERELQAIEEKLADPDCRLLTITGPGGIGKTSLALSVARENIGTFWDGAYFIPLGALTQPNQVLTAIIGELPFSLEGPVDPQKQLVKFLSQKTILLILDNMEHLLGASRFVGDLLSQVPYLKIIVTSRERLNLKLEWVFPLEGLSHPEELSSTNPDQLSGLGAVQLFIRRAQQASGKFSPSPSQYPSIAKICQLLGGVPLGIELAAAWIPYHAPEEIEANIQSNQDFLTTSKQDVHPRHASLRATFEHSWGLLTLAEREVLQKISVFRDSFTLEAARQVAGATQFVLSTLVDKSLIRRYSAGRYGLHSLIGQFVAEKLTSDPDSEYRTRIRLCNFYTEFLYQTTTEYHKDKQRRFLDMIHSEIDNLREVWSWAVRQELWSTLDRAHEGLYDFFDAFGWYTEGSETFEKAISALKKSSMVPDTETNQILGRFLARNARFLIHLGKPEDARDLLQESVHLLQGDDDRALPLSYLGLVAHMQGDYALAAGFAEESLAISRKSSGSEGEAFCLNMLGNIALATGDLDQAKKFHVNNLSIRIAIGDHLGSAVAHNNLANIAHVQGLFAEAKEQYQGSYKSFEKLNHRLGMAATLSNAGFMASKLAEFEEAQRFYEDSLTIKRELGDQQSVAITLLNLCELSATKNELAKAHAFFQEAFTLLSSVQATPLILESLVCYSLILMKNGNKPRAVELLTIAQAHPSSKHETQQRASGLLEELEKDLPDDTYSSAFKLGKQRELGVVITELMGK